MGQIFGSLFGKWGYTKSTGVNQPIVDNTTLPPTGETSKEEYITIGGLQPIVDKWAGVINAELRGFSDKKTKLENLEAIKWGLTQISTEVFNYGKEEGAREILSELDGEG